MTPFPSPISNINMDIPHSQIQLCCRNNMPMTILSFESNIPDTDNITMIAATSLENKNGRSFFGKRLSSDREIPKKLVSISTEIYTDEYSYSHIPDELKSNFHVLSNTEDLNEKQLFWTEIGDIPKNTDKLIIFRWNRDYGADKFYDPIKNGWILVSSEDFSGYSHEKITMETYEK